MVSHNNFFHAGRAMGPLIILLNVLNLLVDDIFGVFYKSKNIENKEFRIQ